MSLLSNRQILIPIPLLLSSLLPSLLQPSSQIRTHDGDVIRKPGNGLEELSKQYKDAVDLDQEARQWPPQ